MAVQPLSSRRQQPRTESATATVVAKMAQRFTGDGAPVVDLHRSVEVRRKLSAAGRWSAPASAEQSGSELPRYFRRCMVRSRWRSDSAARPSLLRRKEAEAVKPSGVPSSVINPCPPPLPRAATVEFSAATAMQWWQSVTLRWLGSSSRDLRRSCSSSGVVAGSASFPTTACDDRPDPLLPRLRQ
nr:hypothetical protein Iba_chr11bCG13640 [Ipomoea batatas]